MEGTIGELKLVAEDRHQYHPYYFAAPGNENPMDKSGICGVMFDPQ